MPPTRLHAAQVSPGPKNRDRSSPVPFANLRQTPRSVDPVVDWSLVEHGLMSIGWQDLATCDKRLPVIALNRYQKGHRTTPICHLKRLALGNSSEVPTRVLTKLSYSDSFHMLQSSTSSPLGRPRQRSAHPLPARFSSPGAVIPRRWPPTEGPNRTPRRRDEWLTGRSRWRHSVDLGRRARRPSRARTPSDPRSRRRLAVKGSPCRSQLGRERQRRRMRRADSGSRRATSQLRSAGRWRSSAR